MRDSRDKRLIYELNWNARQSYSELSKKIHLSKQAVRYRVEQLEKKEIIKGYHALIDWRALGYNSLRIYIKWQNITPEKEGEIYEFIRKNNLFMWSVKFEGEIDIAFYVWIKSIPKFSQKWFSFLEKYGQYILRQEIYESVTMNHYPMKPLIDNFQSEEKVIGLNPVQEIDEIDNKILVAITDNARISILELAKIIRMTPKAAQYRLKQLQQKKIILGYNAFIDTSKLGFVFYKVDFFLRKFDKIKQMEEFSKQNRNIVYRMRTIGGPDFEIELMVNSVVEMRRIVENIRTMFAGEINHFRIHRFEYTLKQIYLPGEHISDNHLENQSV